MGTEDRLVPAPGEVLRDYVGAFVDGLVQAGVRHVCLCPGSRSTPLALMVRWHKGLKTWVHLDERSCAYFALGMAKVLREPVALVCTSGTAGLNFGPAVAEAFYSRVPLVVLTADRPPELRGVGANQTIDQVRLYGGHVKWSEEMMLPEGSPAALRYARTMAARAVSTASVAPRGPVHLNLPFREPLVPARPQRREGGVQSRPAPATSRGEERLPAHEVEALAAEIGSVTRGLIVCGPQDDPRFPAAVTALANSLGFPVLADALSQVRCGEHVSENVVAGFDNFLRDRQLAASLAPEVVLRFGAPPVSKALSQFLEVNQGKPHYLVCDGEVWPDPERTATRFIFADPRGLCEDLVPALGGAGRVQRDQEWVGMWQRAEAATEMTLAKIDEKVLSEPQLFRSLSQQLPEDSIVYAGNSMPVRDLDSFFPAGECRYTFLANRGTSGIDGVVSSALGVAAATEQRVVLVIGDLSFYHDMNGLLAIRRFGLDVTIVLINNDGGGIFSFLPQSEGADDFEELFGTPHGLDFRPAAEMYALTYACPRSADEFDALLKKSFARKDSCLIEVKTDRAANVVLHNEIWARVQEAVSAVVRP